VARQRRPLIAAANWLSRMLAHFPLLRPDLGDLLMHVGICFGVRLSQDAFPWPRAGIDDSDFTAGELHDWACQQLRAQGKAVPDDSWHRLQAKLSDITGVQTDLVQPKSLIQRDLHYFEGG
jgi:hypothetical protein